MPAHDCTTMGDQQQPAAPEVVGFVMKCLLHQLVDVKESEAKPDLQKAELCKSSHILLSEDSSVCSYSSSRTLVEQPDLT